MEFLSPSHREELVRWWREKRALYIEAAFTPIGQASLRMAYTAALLLLLLAATLVLLWFF